MVEKILTFYKSSQCHFSDEDQEKVKILFNKERASYGRLKEVFLSRQALIEGLCSFGVFAKEEDLQIHEYHFLENFPEYLVSISHNPEIFMAALALKNDFFSIGIDIELKNRKITNGADRFFLTQRDTSQFSHLEMWVMKEACFKSLTPYLSLNRANEKKITLKDIWINEAQEFGIKLEKYPIGEVSLEIIIIEEKKYLLAKSYILN